MPEAAFVLVMNALRPTPEARHHLSASEVLALVVVADRCGGADGSCTASLPTLAVTAGVSRATLQRAVASLVRAGWLTRKRRHRDLTDLLQLGPKLSKTSQPETSHRATSKPETSQPGALRSHGATAERSHGETQSSPLKLSVEALPSAGAAAASVLALAPSPHRNGNGAATATAEVVSWSREACEAWVNAFGGTAPGGRIGKALKPLVARHGWEVVRPAWRRYLAEKDAEFATPNDFAARFGLWSGARSESSNIAASKATIGRWLAAKGGA